MDKSNFNIKRQPMYNITDGFFINIHHISYFWCLVSLACANMHKPANMDTPANIDKPYSPKYECTVYIHITEQEVGGLLGRYLLSSI